MKKFFGISFFILLAVVSIVNFQNCSNQNSMKFSSVAQDTSDLDPVPKSEDVTPPGILIKRDDDIGGSVMNADVQFKSVFLKPLNESPNCAQEQSELDLKEEMKILAELYKHPQGAVPNSTMSIYGQYSPQNVCREANWNSLVGMRPLFRKLYLDQIGRGVLGTNEQIPDRILILLDGGSWDGFYLKSQIEVRKQQISKGILDYASLLREHQAATDDLNLTEKRMNELIDLHQKTIKTIAKKTSDYFRCHTLSDGSRLNIDLSEIWDDEITQTIEKFAKNGLGNVSDSRGSIYTDLPNPMSRLWVSEVSLGSDLFSYLSFNQFDYGRTFLNLPSGMKAFPTQGVGSPEYMLSIHSYLGEVEAFNFENPFLKDIGAGRAISAMTGWILSPIQTNKLLYDEIQRYGISQFVRDQRVRIQTACDETCRGINHISIVNFAISKARVYTDGNDQDFIAKFKEHVFMNNILFRAQREYEAFFAQDLLNRLKKANRWIDRDLVQIFPNGSIIHRTLGSEARFVNFRSGIDPSDLYQDLILHQLCREKKLCEQYLSMNNNPSQSDLEAVSKIRDSAAFHKRMNTQNEINSQIVRLRVFPELMTELSK